MSMEPSSKRLESIKSQWLRDNYLELIALLALYLVPMEKQLGFIDWLESDESILRSYIDNPIGAALEFNDM